MDEYLCPARFHDLHCACRVTVTRWTDTCVQHDFQDTLCVSCHSNTMDEYLCPARVCHENRAGHKYPSIVLLLHDTHSVCHENRAGHKYPSIVLLLHDTHSLCPENRAGHKYPSIVLLLHDTHSVVS